MDLASTHPVHPSASRFSLRKFVQPSVVPPRPPWRGARCKICAHGKRAYPPWNSFQRMKYTLEVRRTSFQRGVVSSAISSVPGEQSGETAEARNRQDDEDLPSMSDIVAAAEEKGLRMKLKSSGLFFSVQALSLAGADLGRAEGFILPWFKGSILHLDWIRLTKMSAQNRTSTLGVGLFIGAVAVRHGLDCSCSKAELLAINDSPEYHSKLVRYYNRLGFKAVHEVTGGRLQDIPHMLVWGGVGTRMDAHIRHLLQKWSSSLRPSKGSSSNVSSGA